MSFQGVEFTPDMRKMAVNVKLFFDNLKSNADFLSNPATKLAASALGISESTVKVIMAAYNKKGKEGLDWSRSKQRGRPAYAVESGVVPPVRQFIRRANTDGEQVNVEIIRRYMLPPAKNGPTHR